MSTLIRCWTCGNFYNGKYELYLSMIQSGISKEDALDALELKRYCCRNHILSTWDPSEKMYI